MVQPVCGDDWVTAEIKLRGSDSTKHIADEKIVMQHTHPQLNDNTLLEQGTISVQAESDPAEFRRIELLVLEE